MDVSRLPPPYLGQPLRAGATGQARGKPPFSARPGRPKRQTHRQSSSPWPAPGTTTRRTAKCAPFHPPRRRRAPVRALFTRPLRAPPAARPRPAGRRENMPARAEGYAPQHAEGGGAAPAAVRAQQDRAVPRERPAASARLPFDQPGTTRRRNLLVPRRGCACRRAQSSHTAAPRAAQQADYAPAIGGIQDERARRPRRDFSVAYRPVRWKIDPLHWTGARHKRRPMFRTTATTERQRQHKDESPHHHAHSRSRHCPLPAGHPLPDGAGSRRISAQPATDRRARCAEP